MLREGEDRDKAKCDDDDDDIDLRGVGERGMLAREAPGEADRGASREEERG